MASIINNEYESDVSQTDDENSDYEPVENDLCSSEYNSSDSEPDFIVEDTKEYISDQLNATLMSKDKTIKYTLEQPKINQHTISSHRINSGATVFASSRCVDPLSAFLIFIEPFEKTVVDMTNLCGSHKYGSEWKEVDSTTMRAYYGILLLAGIYRAKDECITELWNDITGRPIFKSVMSLERYKEITRCLRFDDPEEIRKQRFCDKFAPIRTIFEKWVNRLKVNYMPGKNVTVDEQLLPFRGRCPFTQFMPAKPCKYGLRHWSICDASSHYVYGMDIYIGRERNCSPEVPKAEQVILKLTDGLKWQKYNLRQLFHIAQLGHKIETAPNDDCWNNKKE